MTTINRRGPRTDTCRKTDSRMHSVDWNMKVTNNYIPTQPSDVIISEALGFSLRRSRVCGTISKAFLDQSK